LNLSDILMEVRVKDLKSNIPALSGSSSLLKTKIPV
jgi:hypothetical protein